MYFSDKLDLIDLQIIDVVSKEGRLAVTDIARRIGSSKSALNEFNAAIKIIPEIEQCHMIASSFDYLLKIRTQNIRAYRHILGEVISTLPYVASTSTFVAMESVKDFSF